MFGVESGGTPLVSMNFDISSVRPFGENTGKLDTALLNVSYFYNREVRESIAKVQAMIEPALTVVLGAILGWVMLSVLGPVYDAISKMKF